MRTCCEAARGRLSGMFSYGQKIEPAERMECVAKLVEAPELGQQVTKQMFRPPRLSARCRVPRGSA
jgi:hypothetical protein